MANLSKEKGQKPVPQWASIGFICIGIQGVCIYIYVCKTYIYTYIHMYILYTYIYVYIYTYVYM